MGEKPIDEGDGSLALFFSKKAELGLIFLKHSLACFQRKQEEESSKEMITKQ